VTVLPDQLVRGFGHHCVVQAYIAIAAAAPAFMERVDPYWVIATNCSHPLTTSSVNPGPSDQKTKQQSGGSWTVSSGTDPGRLSTPTGVTPCSSSQCRKEGTSG